MRYFVTGGAGFIGSNLVDRLLGLGHQVVAYDNFSTGRLQFLEAAERSSNFTLHRGDLLDADALRRAMRGCDFIFHLSANADVRYGTEHPRKDLEQNAIATFNVLEGARQNAIAGIAFSSTGSIYGEPEIFPTPEDAPFPVQTSLYGASKLAGEGLIAAYAEGFGLRAWIFRFVSVLGERYTHGHIYDFFQALNRDPTRLHILGNGKQRKSYMHIGDCIDAMLLAIDRADSKVNILNLGNDEYCAVIDSVGWICNYLGVKPELSFGGGERGWIGDSPFIYLDTKKIRMLGWQPKNTIRQGVERTLTWLQKNEWVFESHT